MSQISRLLHKEAEKSNGKMKVVKVPKKMRPTYDSLMKLKNEIYSQVGLRNFEYKNVVEIDKEPLLSAQPKRLVKKNKV